MTVGRYIHSLGYRLYYYNYITRYASSSTFVGLFYFVQVSHTGRLSSEHRNHANWKYTKYNPNILNKRFQVCADIYNKSQNMNPKVVIELDRIIIIIIINRSFCKKSRSRQKVIRGKLRETLLRFKIIDRPSKIKIKTREIFHFVEISFCLFRKY